MPVTINATPGSVSANSYATLAEAEAYYALRLDSGEWTGTNDAKSIALISATRRLEQETWAGIRATQEQALAWPRFDTYDRDGWTYDSDIIPTAVKNAVYELTISMMKNDLLADTGLEGFTEVQVGSLRVVPRHGQIAGELPENVVREIAHVLDTPSTSNIRVKKG